MRNRKILSVFVAALFVFAFAAGSALACDGKAKSADAETASVKAEAAKAEMAKAGKSCSSSSAATAEVASTKAAGASCASKGATASVAGASCASKGATASVAGAGSSCASGAKMAIALETVRMPSGALAIFYNGKDDASIAALHQKAEAKGAAFGCDLASSVAANENCSVEVAMTKTGIMMLVTSEKAEEIDAISASYDVAMAGAAEETEGE